MSRREPCKNPDKHYKPGTGIWVMDGECSECIRDERDALRRSPARGAEATEEMVERALTSGPIPNYCNFGHLLKRAGIANGQDWMRAALEAAIGGGDK